MVVNRKWDKMWLPEVDHSMLSFLDKKTAFLDKGNVVDILYPDFSKVFDILPDGELLVQLKMGISTRILRN